MDQTVTNYIIVVVLIVLAALVGNVLNQLIRRFLDKKVGKKLSKNTARLVQYALLILAASYAFGSILALDLSSIILSLGLVGVAVAFASQQIIQNFISGIIISITRPIQLEDWIQVGLAPDTGICRVKDITLMSTVLREADGRIIIIPNSQIINGKVINYTKAGFTGVTFPLWIANIDSLDRIKRIVYEEADRDPRILPEVTGEEKAAFLRIFERPALKALLGEDGNPSYLNPQVNVSDIQGTRTKVVIKVWIREVNKRDEILSGFMAVIRTRFDQEGVELRDP